MHPASNSAPIPAAYAAQPDARVAARSAPARWLDAETLTAVRPPVRSLLESSESFGALPVDDRKRLAENMVKVAAYLSNPEGVVSEALTTEPAPTTTTAPVTSTPSPSTTGGERGQTASPSTRTRAASGAPIARAQAEDPNTTLRRRLASDPGFASEDFKGGAITAGVDQFRRMVTAVDFPNFVSGLIQNVFQAIVDSSIQQMRAYGELLANIAKSVDEFAQDNISEANSRDWLAQRFPGQLRVDTESFGGGFAGGFASGLAEGDQAAPVARLAPTENLDDAGVAMISRTLQMNPPLSDLSDENEELRLVNSARLQMARSRQQLLSSMVMLGINRIVITDGQINAKVLFDMRAQDIAKRAASASMMDRKREQTQVKHSASIGGWLSPVEASLEAQASTDHMATVSSSVDDTSEARAEVKAKLSGEVRVNFKSDYLPMEKLATPQMIAAIQGNATPTQPPLEGA